MKIGITGASGLIGKALHALLLKRGYEVVAFLRDEELANAAITEVRRYDADKSEQTDVSGLHALVHLAGEPVLGYWTAKKKKAIRSTRVEGTRGLVDAIAASEHRPKIFVSASAIGFYGDRADELLSEQSQAGNGFLAEVSQAWEAEALRAESLGLRVVCGRIGMVLGREGGAAPMLKKLFQMGLGGRLGAGEQWMSWVHVDDVARMFLYAIEEKGMQGAVNFCAPNPVRNSEFTRMLARRLKRPAFAWVPAPLLKLLVGGMSEMLLYSGRVDPEVLKTSDYTWHCEEIAEAFKEVM